MNRDKIGTQTYYVHQHTSVGTLICLCSDLVSVHFYAIPIFQFTKIFIYLCLVIFYYCKQ